MSVERNNVTFITNNCADLVKSCLAKAGINLNNDEILGMGILPNVPNLQYNNAKEKAKEQIILNIYWNPEDPSSMAFWIEQERMRREREEDAIMRSQE